jgi:phospholipid-binding lipoprotein MlaA
MRALYRPPMLASALPVLASALIVIGLSGCASEPPASDPDAVADFKQTNDPLEPTNRVFYAINNGLDAVVLRPLAVGYRYAVPDVVRSHVHNVLTNLDSPVTLTNDVMQAKPRRAGDTLMRFVINSTVGVAGVFDVASDWGYPVHGTDFGVTLALWGVPEGPFLFLPVLGPSNPRDASGFGVDIALDPFTWVGKGTTVNALGYARYGVTAVDARERVLNDLDKVKASALDPYATFRSLYRQYRASQVDQTRSDNRTTVPAWFATPPASVPAPGTPAQ